MDRRQSLYQLHIQCTLNPAWVTVVQSQESSSCLANGVLNIAAELTQPLGDWQYHWILFRQHLDLFMFPSCRKTTCMLVLVKAVFESLSTHTQMPNAGYMIWWEIWWDGLPVSQNHPPSMLQGSSHASRTLFTFREMSWCSVLNDPTCLREMAVRPSMSGHSRQQVVKY